MKKEIDVFEKAGDILAGIKKGALVTVKGDDKVNPMSISWGTLGIEWNKPIFTVFVRENRYTKSQLDKIGEFTINIPVGDYDKNIISFCGTKSGHNVNKVEELGLTLVDSDTISVPGLKELPLTLECKVIYKQAQDPNEITKENKEKCYPNVSSDFHGANQDYHTAFYGEIVKAYIIE